MSIPRENLSNPQFIDTAYAKATEAIVKQKFVTEAGAIADAGEAGCPVEFDFAIGDDISVIRTGTAKVIAGAAVSVGDDVESDAQGRAITLNTGVKNGRALTAAAQAGDIIVISVP